MNTAEEARASLALHNTPFHGKHLRVDMATVEKKVKIAYNNIYYIYQIFI